MERVGLPEVRARLDAIAADRATSYVPFGAAVPAWRTVR
jgi:hypothetical protein